MDLLELCRILYLSSLTSMFSSDDSDEFSSGVVERERDFELLLEDALRLSSSDSSALRLRCFAAGFVLLEAALPAARVAGLPAAGVAATAGVLKAALLVAGVAVGAHVGGALYSANVQESLRSLNFTLSSSASSSYATEHTGGAPFSPSVTLVTTPGEYLPW